MSSIGAVVIVLLATAGAAYVKLNGNITRVDVSKALGKRPSTSTLSKGASRPLNILVMGSDTRQGIGTSEFGHDTIEGGAHSDTNLVVHLSADRQRALVVSIPRDSMTMAPKSCKDPNSTVANGELRQWNYNFNLGGPGCVIKTVEGLTGVFIDHYVVVDFRGFQQMVDALGGVSVCTSQDIDDQDSKFTLAAGRHVLDGEQALGYVRVRKTIGDGSDLNRIKRQQAFLSSVIQQATSSKLLLRPDHLFSFLNAATKSMTTDPALGLGTMRDIASSVRDIGMDKIQFVTVPTEPYPADTNRVQWRTSADALWAAVRSDTPLPGSAGAPKPSATSTTATALTVSPDRITVQISNESGVDGLAVQTGGALQVQGFGIGGYVNGSVAAHEGTVISYGPGKAESARTVAAAFPGAKTELDKSLGETLVVHLGPGSPNPVAVPNRIGSQPLPSMPLTASSSTESLQTRAASEDICS